MDGYDIHGNIIKSVMNIRDANNCHRLCNKEAECRAWTYNKPLKKCWMHSAAERIKKNSDCILGWKTCPFKKFGNSKWIVLFKT